MGCVYRHPKSKICEFTERLDALLKYLNQCKYQVVLLGDINIDFLRYITHQMTEKYLDMLYTNNFLPIITKPTRITDHTKTLIDHIYTNMAIDQVKSGIAIFDISDHLPVFTVIKTSCNRIQDTLYYRDYRTFKQEDFLSELTQINWDENLRHLNNNIHQSTKNIINHIERVTQRHAPMKEVSQSKLKQLNKPWITNGILKSIKVKQRMYRTHFYSNDTSKVTQYKRYANKLNRIKSISKLRYYNNQFDKCKNNLKATWKIIGTLIKRKSKRHLKQTRIIRNDVTYTNEYDIANQFNQHFVNVGPNLANKLPTSNLNAVSYIQNSPISSFSMSPLTVSQVHVLFQSLDTSKASISIPNFIVKTAADVLAPIFCCIYNESISLGVVPNILKISRVTPIFKNGVETDPNNYRPISIISPFAKAFERLVYEQLNSFLVKKKIISNYQFGFRKGYSTEQAILEITENFKSAIDNGEITCGLFLDLSKAFDTVNHQILIDKLCKYGIRGTPLAWFTDYLSNRQQYVKIGNTESDLLTLTCGIPQGSTLGPLLFILYINDMPNCSKKLSFRIFADDTNVFYSSNSIDDIEKVMNEELQNILQYCNVNKLSINIKKTNFMVITSCRKKTRRIKIGNFEQKSYIKYLGIYIDQNLSWHQQISHVYNKIVKNTGIISKLRYCIDLNMLKQVYYSLIFPYINYGLMSWGNTYATKLKKLKSCQNKCIRKIFFIGNYEDASAYYNLLGILKIDNVFKLKIAVFTFKIINMNEKVPTILSDIIVAASSRHSHYTRFVSNYNIIRPKVRTNYGIQTFAFTSSKIWESIETSLKESYSILQFKKKYSQILLISQ